MTRPAATAWASSAAGAWKTSWNGGMRFQNYSRLMSVHLQVEGDMRNLGLPLGYAALFATAIVYCLPGHPAAHTAGLDFAAHLGLFCMVTLVVTLSLPAKKVVTALFAMSIALELVQSCVGGFEGVEWRDIAGNLVGTWIGLLMSARMNGRIHVESESSQGKGPVVERKAGIDA